MPERLPTKDGDAFITHRTSVATTFHVWSVVQDGQQSSLDLLGPSVFTSLASAVHFARMLTVKTGRRVFRPEQDDGDWEQLPHG